MNHESGPLNLTLIYIYTRMHTHTHTHTHTLTHIYIYIYIYVCIYKFESHLSMCWVNKKNSFKTHLLSKYLTVLYIE